MMSHSIKIKLATSTFVMLGAMVVSSAAFASASCGGCSELQAATEALRKVDTRNDAAIGVIVEQATNAIANLPKEKKNKLSTLQIREVVNLLRETEKQNLASVMEDNGEMLMANKTELFTELKRLPPAEAKSIGLTLSAVFDEMAGGQDTVEHRVPKTKPAKK